MSCRLVAAPRICSRSSCAGVARFASRVPPYSLSRQWRLVAQRGGTPGIRFAWSIAAQIPTAVSDRKPQAEETVIQKAKDGVEDDLDVHYASILKDSAGDDQALYRFWKPFRAVGNTVDEGIINVVDAMESIVSFEGDENSPEVPCATYWNKLSHLLAFAYGSGNARARHALDVYRYRARESLTEASTTANLDKHTTVSILAGCLANSARDTLAVLSGPGYMPFFARADCCYHLRQISVRWDEIKGDPTLQELFRQQLEHIRDRKEWLKTSRRLQPVKARHLDLMLEALPTSEALELVTDWQNMFPFMTDADLLYLVEFYTKMEDVDNAIKLLRQVSPALLKNPNEWVIGRCVKLLQLDVVDGDSHTHSFRILPVLLELGLPPLDVIHQLAVQNAAKSGLISVSMDLYRSLLAQKTSAADSPHTTSVLLKQTFVHRDLEAMNELMTMIQSRHQLLRDPHVMSVMINIIRHICYYERRASPEECLSYVLAIYDRAYNRDALARLGILQPDQANGGDTTLPDPHPMVLANTIWAYVLTQTHEERVRELWSSILHLIEHGDRQIKEAVDISGVFRAFLIFYQRSPFTLTAMVEVLEYVLDNSPHKLDDTDWAIVVNGYLKHGKEDNAKQVRAMMHALGRNFSSKGLQSMLERWPQQWKFVAFVRDVEAGTVPVAHSPVSA